MGFKSDTEICNMALARIGINKFISSIDDNNSRAEACKTFYASSRDRVLEMFPWSFAVKRAALSVLTGAAWDSATPYAAKDLVAYGSNIYRAKKATTNEQPDISTAAWDQVTRDGWGFVAPLPADCVTPLQIWQLPTASGVRTTVAHPIRPPVIRGERSDEREKYEVENANDGSDARILLCDIDKPVLKYVASVTNPTAFSALFGSTVAWLLAHELCGPLRADAKMAQTAYAGFHAALGEAAAASARQNREDDEPVSEFEASREGF